MARSTVDVPQTLRRIVTRRTAAWLVWAVAAACNAPVALAQQETGGPIVIPGNGEQNPADLTRMTEMATTGHGGGARPVNTAPAAGIAEATAAAPAAASANSIEIDSLASRGEPPELGASAPGRNPAYTAAAPVAASARFAAAPLQTSVPRQSQAQALAEAAQRAQVIQALQRVQVAQAPVKPVVVNPAFQPAQAATPAQSTQPVQTAQPVPEGQEDGELIHAAALDFLKQQANGLPGQVELSVASAFPRGLAACATLQPFMPNGARLWGRTTVGVRCTGGHPWTVWLQAKVSVHATYYVAARAMLPGEVISEADIEGRDGDLTMLPMSIVTAPSQAVGSVALLRIGAGMPLRQDMLKNSAEVTAGQMVRVVAQGDGFSISSEGSALSSATPGQPVRVRTSTGLIIMGIVKDSGTVQMPM